LEGILLEQGVERLPGGTPGLPKKGLDLLLCLVTPQQRL